MNSFWQAHRKRIDREIEEADAQIRREIRWFWFVIAFGLLSVILTLARYAQAQTTNVFGPQGQYLGTVTQIGPTTNIYGPQGQWLGMATTIGQPTPWMPAPVTPIVPAWPLLPTWGK